MTWRPGTPVLSFDSGKHKRCPTGHQCQEASEDFCGGLELQSGYARPPFQPADPRLILFITPLLFRPRVSDPRLGPAPVHQGLQPLPAEAVSLRPSAQRLQPYPFQDVGEASQEAGARWDCVVVQPPVDDPPQPPGDLVEVVVPAPPKNLRDALQSTAHPLCSGLASKPEPLAPSLRAVVHEAQEVERLRAAQPSCPAVHFREPAELDEPGLVRMQGQIELAEPLPKRMQDLFCVLPVLEGPPRCICRPRSRARRRAGSPDVHTGATICPKGGEIDISTEISVSVPSVHPQLLGGEPADR